MANTEGGGTVGIVAGEFGVGAVFGDDGDGAGGEDRTGWWLDFGGSGFEIGLPSFEFLARVGAAGGVSGAS